AYLIEAEQAAGGHVMTVALGNLQMQGSDRNLSIHASGGGEVESFGGNLHLQAAIATGEDERPAAERPGRRCCNHHARRAESDLGAIECQREWLHLGRLNAGQLRWGSGRVVWEGRRDLTGEVERAVVAFAPVGRREELRQRIGGRRRRGQRGCMRLSCVERPATDHRRSQQDAERQREQETMKWNGGTPARHAGDRACRPIVTRNHESISPCTSLLTTSKLS